MHISCPYAYEGSHTRMVTQSDPLGYAYHHEKGIFQVSPHSCMGWPIRIWGHSANSQRSAATIRLEDLSNIKIVTPKQSATKQTPQERKSNQYLYMFFWKVIPINDAMSSWINIFTDDNPMFCNKIYTNSLPLEFLCFAEKQIHCLL